jgi:hypothetical protein
MGHESLGYKDESQDSDEDSSEKQYNGQTREYAQFTSPPRLTLFMGYPTLFDTESAARSEA